MATHDAKIRRKSSRPPPMALARASVAASRELSLTPNLPADVTVTRFSIGDEEVALVTYPIAPDDAAMQLTLAEREIIGAVLAGKTNAEIAFERGSAERTVANQVASAYRKLAVRSRAELAARCAFVGRSD